MHDFRSFTDDDPDEKSTKVEIEELRWKQCGDLILVRMRGSHFVWKMVRRVVGVLAEVGRGSMPPQGGACACSAKSQTFPHDSRPPRPGSFSNASIMRTNNFSHIFNR